MANGDPVGKGHYVFGPRTLLTNTDALQDFINVDLSALDGGLLGVDSIITVKGWVHGRHTDDSNWVYSERIATAHVDAGSLDVEDGADQHHVELGDPLVANIECRITQSTNTLKLQVITSTTDPIRWHGALEIWITEQAMTG